MPSLAIAREANANFSPSPSPVAIFLGGTSGIGQGTASAFARHTKGNAHIIIIGRNRNAAEAFFETFPKTPESKYEFVCCDASLIRNVAETTSALLARLPKVNYMVLTSGAIPPLWDTIRGVQHPTEEGLDHVLALAYYSRTKFMLDLLPLLQKAKDAGEDARVLNVVAAGHGGPVDYNDMGLRKTYSLRTLRPIMVTYTDMAMEVSAAPISRPQSGAYSYEPVADSGRPRTGLHFHSYLSWGGQHAALPMVGEAPHISGWHVDGRQRRVHALRPPQRRGGCPAEGGARRRSRD